ncbi:MAG: acyl-CoA dehydrogenase [Candidatus Binatia bacterium]|nr:MAG: acyl-CoA dehydrogenase [Candidatus Binatia bacterium]
MDLTPHPRIEELRREFRTWLRSNLPPREGWERLRHRPGADPERLDFLRAWQRRLAEARWVAVHWPVEYGGRGGSLLEHLVVQEELLRAEAPPLVNGPSLAIFGPTLLACGTPEQKRRFLPPLVRAEEIWCLGFSEPDAGSDLASLRTRAVREGDFWVVDGQKVWSTYANQADWCFLLVRTDPEAPKHRGISCLLVPMRTPGITVRPLREITGDTDFNEVFFDRVRVPAENVVGEVHRGWQVVLTALGHERGTLVVVEHVRYRRALDRLESFVAATRRRSDPRIRQALAQFEIEVKLVELRALRVLGDLERARPPTDVSVLKLFASEMVQRLQDFALTLQGPYAQLWRGTPRAIDDGDTQYQWLMARASTIASGTSEVQRNIIAERLLGLPRGG